MRQYKKPYFQTKQYWGLVEILKSNLYKKDGLWYLKNIEIFMPSLLKYLKNDNPNFNEDLFLKAIGFSR